MRPRSNFWLALVNIQTDGLAGIEENFDTLKAFIVEGQYLHVCPPDLAIYLKEKKTDDLSELANMTERFLDARIYARPHKFNKPNTSDQETNIAAIQKHDSNYKSQAFQKQKGGKRYFACDNLGHIQQKNCTQRVKANAMTESVTETEPKLHDSSCAMINAESSNAIFSC